MTLRAEVSWFYKSLSSMISDGSVRIKDLQLNLELNQKACCVIVLVHGSSFDQNFFILSKRHTSHVPQ